MTFAIKRNAFVWIKAAASSLAALLCLLLGVFGNYLLLILAVPVVMVAAATAAELFRGSYYLGDGLIECRLGLQTVLVEYHQIRQVTTDGGQPVQGYTPMALDKDKLYIYYTHDDGNLYRLELSPKDKQGFIDVLNQRLYPGETK